ncbi:hypothetical protein GQR58_000329 [Nymphon striatum]|nr:hypothetical protein GQR58_000329 [Nymphon striatum]
MMETVNDFGTVDYFAVQTLTTGIFSVWLESNNAGGAAQIASVILLLVVLLVTLEKSSRNKLRYFSMSRHHRPMTRKQLTSVGRGGGVCGLLDTVCGRVCPARRGYFFARFGQRRAMERPCFDRRAAEYVNSMRHRLCDHRAGGRLPCLWGSIVRPQPTAAFATDNHDWLCGPGGGVGCRNSDTTGVESIIFWRTVSRCCLGSAVRVRVGAPFSFIVRVLLVAPIVASPTQKIRKLIGSHSFLQNTCLSAHSFEQGMYQKNLICGYREGQALFTAQVRARFAQYCSKNAARAQDELAAHSKQNKKVFPQIGLKNTLPTRLREACGPTNAHFSKKNSPNLNSYFNAAWTPMSTSLPAAIQNRGRRRFFRRLKNTFLSKIHDDVVKADDSISLFRSDNQRMYPTVIQRKKVKGIGALNIRITENRAQLANTHQAAVQIVIVIDDPTSSPVIRSSGVQAFSLSKERGQNAHQVFPVTHISDFLKLYVKLVSDTPPGIVRREELTGCFHCALDPALVAKPRPRSKHMLDMIEFVAPVHYKALKIRSAVRALVAEGSI